MTVPNLTSGEVRMLVVLACGGGSGGPPRRWRPMDLTIEQCATREELVRLEQYEYVHAYAYQSNERSTLTSSGVSWSSIEVEASEKGKRAALAPWLRLLTSMSEANGGRRHVDTLMADAAVDLAEVERAVNRRFLNLFEKASWVQREANALYARKDLASPLVAVLTRQGKMWMPVGGLAAWF